MHWTSWALPGICAALLAASLLAWIDTSGLRRNTRTLRALFAALALWASGNALETLAVDPAVHGVALRLAYVGVQLVPPLWFLWLCDYTGVLRASRPLYAGLLVLPVISALLALGNDAHGLVWTRLSSTTGALGEPVWIIERGPLWMLQASYSYTLMIASLTTLGYGMWRSRWARAHLALLFLIAAAPVLSSALYIGGVTRTLTPVDLTPAAFALSLGLLALLIRHPIRRLLPISQSMILDSLRTGVVTLDTQGWIVNHNASADALLDGQLERSGDLSFDDLVPHYDRAGSQDGTPRMVEVPSGAGVRQIEMRSAPVFDRHGRDLGSVVLMDDRSTELRTHRQLTRAMQALNDRADDLEEAGAGKTRFLANISHELRAPLGAIIGFAEVLKDELAGPLPDAARARAERIHAQGEQLLRQVTSILDLEKSEAGALTLRTAPLEVATWSPQAFGALQRQGRAQGVEVAVVLESESPRPIVDAEKARQILVNLGAWILSTPPLPVAIEARVKPSDQALDIELLVRGPGVRGPDARQLREPFWQTQETTAAHHSREVRLGLALVTRLVDLHEGRFEVDSPQADTQRYAIHLPAQPEAGLAASAPDGAGLTSSGSRAT